MTKDAFLAALREGLRGMKPSAADEIVADYASHFDEGMAHGRSEQDIAAALGDPARLARELKAEQGLKRWDEERSPSAAAGAILAILSLGAIDILFLLPILIAVISVIFALGCAAVGVMIGGLITMIASPFAVFAGAFVQTLLTGLGLLAAGSSLGALVALAAIGTTNLLIRFGRFHIRLLKPIAE